MVVTGPFESYAVADAHDGVINGIRMAGHVKTCRGWDQLFKDGNLHMVQRIQCYSTQLHHSAVCVSHGFMHCPLYTTISSRSQNISFQFVDGYVGPTITCIVWIYEHQQ